MAWDSTTQSNLLDRRYGHYIVSLGRDIPADTDRQLSDGKRAVLDLSRNENADPAPDLLCDVITEAVSRLGRYPIGLQEGLAKQVADAYGVAEETVLIVRGVDDAVDTVIAEFPEASFTTFTPSFDGYERRLKIFERRHQRVDVGPAFEIDGNALQTIDSKDVVFIARPNNPTGNVVPLSTLFQIADRAKRLFVDEASVHFSREGSCVAELAHRAFVFHSLSKAFGMAGQRLGFLFGPQREIARMRSRQWFCHIDMLSLVGASHVLRSRWPERHAKDVVVRRSSLQKALLELRLDALPTETNFVLIRTRQAIEMTEFLARNDIRVFDANTFGLPDHVRISVGTPAENRRLLCVLEEFQKTGQDDETRPAAE